MGELEVISELPDPATGELYPAVPQHAARLWRLAADMIDHLRDLQRHVYSPVLADEAQRQGIKTLHLDGFDVTVTGGTSVTYDPHELMAGLMEAGCPPERINALVRETVKYDVNLAVLKQLAAANPTYAAAIEAAKQEVEKPWRASVK